MAYQALLFCPDEKTARTVTQVLSELDFQVSPCTEPFAAVKKLMAERFDAVVVDCDNEQNATLLFKSARNAPNNSSALAVAVVEGQAGVAKAFRIGANLVLTKPINVEQAKGTLRVARGLLRKNESSKTAPAAAPPTKPTNPAPEPRRVSASPAAIPARPNVSAPSATASAAPPKSSASAHSDAPIAEAKSIDEILSVSPEPPEPEIVALPKKSSAEKNTASVPEPPVEAKPEETVSGARPVAHSSVNPSPVAHSGAASAPARALEPKARELGPSAEADPETSKGKVEGRANVESSASVAPEKFEAALPTPTFGVAVSEAKSSSGGKKAVIGVAAAVLIAVAGYWAWTQYGGGHATPASSVQQVQRPIPTPSPAMQSPATPASTAPAISATVPASSLPANSTAQTESNTVAETPHSSSGHAKEGLETHSDADSGPAYKAAPDKSSDESTETVHPITVKRGTEATRPAKSQTVAPPEIAGIGTAQNSTGLSTLVSSSSEPAPVLEAMRVSQGVSQGLIIKKVSPAYPSNAVRLRIEGKVELLATVSKKGDISAIKVLSGDATLTRAAVDAVKQWKYKPYLLDGSPVEIQTQVTVNFKLPR
jgi:TonB family protein